MKKLSIIAFFLLSSLAAKASPTCDHLAYLDTKMNLHSKNLENAETTRTPEGGPYKKQELINCDDVWNCEVVSLEHFRQSYRPNDADANEDGYVTQPDIDSIEEMGSLINVQREYEKAILAEPFEARKCEIPAYLNFGGQKIENTYLRSLIQ